MGTALICVFHSSKLVFHRDVQAELHSTTGFSLIPPAGLSCPHMCSLLGVLFCVALPFIRGDSDSTESP